MWLQALAVELMIVVSEMGFLVETLGFKRDPTLPGFVWLGNLQLAVAKGEPVKNPRFHLGFRMDSQGQVDGMRARLFAVYQAAEGAAIPPISKARRRRLAEIRVRVLIRK